MRPVLFGVALYSMGPLHCPHCRLLVRHLTIYGMAEFNCGSKTCRARLRAVRIPPSTTGEALKAAFGIGVARLLLGGDAPDAELLTRVLQADYVIRTAFTDEPPMSAAATTSLLAAFTSHP